MFVITKVDKGNKRTQRQRRHQRVRNRVSGTAERPRLVVTRSARHLLVQVVDDSVGRTLVNASTLEADLRVLQADKSAKARKVGELVAQRAKAAGITTVVFDRGGHQYHGRVAAVAQAARDEGLQF